MPRNLLERVETLFPIKDPMLKHRIRFEILEAYLADNSELAYCSPTARMFPPTLYARDRPRA